MIILKDDSMTKQEPETKKEEKKAPEEPAEFLRKVQQLGYPFADVTYNVKVIARPIEEDLLSLGFADHNNRRQIVLTSEKQRWKKIAQDILDYIGEGKA